MKAITLRLSDADHAALTVRAADKRYSAAQYLLSLMDADLKSLAASAPKPKLSVAQQSKAAFESERPSAIRNPLLARGWSASWLDSIPRGTEFQLYENGQLPGPDGTANYSQTADQAFVAAHEKEFSAATVAKVMSEAPPVPIARAVAVPGADLDAIDFED